MRYSTMVAFEFEADGIMTAQKVSAAMARGAEAAIGEGRGSVRQVGCLEVAPPKPLKSIREELAEQTLSFALVRDTDN